MYSKHTSIIITFKDQTHCIKIWKCIYINSGFNRYMIDMIRIYSSEKDCRVRHSKIKLTLNT